MFATYLLQVHQRALIVTSLLKVILGRFDDPIDYLGVDASLRVVVQRQHTVALTAMWYSRRQKKRRIIRTTTVFDILSIQTMRISLGSFSATARRRFWLCDRRERIAGDRSEMAASVRPGQSASRPLQTIVLVLVRLFYDYTVRKR